MKHRYSILILIPFLSMTLVACTTPAGRRVEFSSGYPVIDCPDRLTGQVRLQAEVRPLQTSAALDKANSVETTPALGRRLLISVVPSGLRPDDRIVWSTVTIATFGGTFVAWDNLQTDVSSGAAAIGRPAATKRPQEVSTVALSAGQIKIARAARGSKDLSGMYSIDLGVRPGGVPVNDTIVRMPALWQTDGTPLQAASIAPQLVPIRHPPGLDVVQATLQLDFIVRLADTGDEWSCSEETRVTLVDQDALRPPLWDIGLAWSNAGRAEWLALFDPTQGAMRLVFDSPTSAQSFASWIRATESMRVGPYTLTAFRPARFVASRPFGAVNEEIMPTLRPLTAEDLKTITVGPVGEP